MVGISRMEPLGRLAGDYELGPFLGIGGTAAVCTVIHKGTGYPSAAKYAFEGGLYDSIGDRLGMPPGELIEDEARVLRKLSHPNIVRYERCRDGILLMELLKGRSWANHIRSGDRSPEHVENTGKQVASGVLYAHSKRAYVQDVKPTNVYITKLGRAVLFDVGLSSKMVERLSQYGHRLRTPDYTDPELLFAERIAIGPRSDHYALGICLIEALTGKVPRKVSVKKGREPPLTDKLDELVGHAPKKLQRIIGKLIDEEDLEARWDGMAELVGKDEEELLAKVYDMHHERARRRPIWRWIERAVGF